MHIISIYPNYVKAILAGTKTVECRKSSVGVAPGDLLQLYATAPVKAVMGQARVECLHRGTPAELWEQFKHCAGVAEDDFFAYYANAKTAVLIGLTEVRAYDDLVTLTALRSIEDRFSPPQTARRLSPKMEAFFA